MHRESEGKQTMMMEKKRYEQPQTTVTNIEPSGVLCGSKIREYNSLNRNFAVFFFEFDGVDDGGML